MHNRATTLEISHKDFRVIIQESKILLLRLIIINFKLCLLLQSSVLPLTLWLAMPSLLLSLIFKQTMKCLLYFILHLFNQTL